LSIRKKVKILIVDDSYLFRETLAAALDKDFGIEVVGIAGDPYEAKDMILEHEPDVLALDVEMPKMDGISFLKKLMPQYPLPVVVMSSSEQNVFDALGAGAVDFIAKPKSRQLFEAFINELIVKIKIASTAKVAYHKKDYVPEESIASFSGKKAGISETIIAIGASTGGTEAIASIMNALPRELPGILIVQHMPPVFTRLYAERLNRTSRLEVKEAEDGEAVKPGKVLMAPGEYHMKLMRSDAGFFVSCKKGDKVSGHCPSVDVLFDSVAEKAKDKAVGILLTGMGSDGAKGLLNMRTKGAYTIGQDEKSCVVYGMPKVAYTIGAVSKQLSLEKIPQELCEYLAK
jgi:two-component system chemotaxis response regulator CheB